MSYKLRADQSLRRNLRRIFRHEVRSAICLARREKQPDDTLVHDVRKNLKKGRAVLHLVHEQIGRRAFRGLDKRMRDVGRLTRELRDAEVRLKTMRQLEDATQHHYRSYQKIEKVLAFDLENFSAAFDGWEHKALPALERADKRARKWPKTGCKKRHLRRAMQRAYKCGRKALAIAQTNASVANIHELRKQVKRLGYQMSIIQPWNPLVVGEASRELTDLGHLLGRVHDLRFLADRLRLERRERHWGKQDDELLSTIEQSAEWLERDGIESAERFFAERPRKFGEHIAEWFADRKHCQSVAKALVTD